MNTEMKNYLGAAAIIGIILAVIAVFWYVSVYSGSVVPQRTFAASGEGKVIAVPDVAELSFGVLTEGGLNITALQQDNTVKANRIIAFLKENGVDEKDIKSQAYNISPRYQYYDCSARLLSSANGAEPCPPPEIVGYSINHSVLVKVRQLDKAGALLAGMVQNGANNVYGPNLTIDDPTELQNRARAEAVAKARAKAEAVARAAGFRLGKIISISESPSYPPIYYRSLEAVGKGGDNAIPAPSIEPGSQEVTVSVNIVYEMR